MVGHRTSRPWLVLGILFLPLLVIALQRVLGFSGHQNSLYKLFLLLPPLLYCRWRGIRIQRDILRFHRWRNGLALGAALGFSGCMIFVIAYWLFGDLLLDKQKIRDEVSHLFVTRAETVLYVAPVTILANSLLEEFFYRGFVFSQLVAWHRFLGYFLPAAVFMVQHLLFFWHWMQWLPLVIAVVGLFVFALVQQWLYDRAGSIVSPWVSHMFGDLAMMGIAVVMFRFGG